MNWSIIQEIIPIKEESKRNYYINSTIEHNFSVRQLREYIETNAYERLIKKDNIKLKELTIKDIGQIEFYVKYYDLNIKKPFYNPTIGITISKKVNKNVINYNEKKNIRHSTYRLVEK